MKRAFLWMTGLLLAGCVSYEPSPLDWADAAETLEAEPATVEMSVSNLLMRVVAYSPELNALRLAHATSVAKADAAGYWDDPSLDLDVLRILREPKHPWTYGGSVAFTLPVTGIPGLERRAAEAYAAADRWDVVAAEYAAVAESATLARTAIALQKLTAFLDEDRMRADYREARQVSARLVEAGEMSRTDYAQQSVAERELDQTLFELRQERLAAETQLRRRAGLSQTCAFVWKEEDVVPELAIDELTLLDFVRAPKVRAACARYAAKEADLKKEIRRQYPELSLGPAYTREDGYDRVGLTLGLTLPLWNRNRAGIAAADGARDESAHAAFTAWQDVISEFAEAKQALALVGDWKVDSARDAAERLYAAGELTAGEYVACVQQDWTQLVNVLRRRLAAISAIHKINMIVQSLSEEEE